jgi:regulator of protease activity HflC (stomatin/prohibitin superfamily)
MALIRVVKIGANERGLRFVGKEFRGVLRPGWHVAFDPLFRARVDVVSVREPWLVHRDLEVIARSGALGIEACVLDLAQHERALVWIDGRFAGIRTPGLSAVWTVFHKVRIEVVDARALRFEHPELAMILSQPGVEAALETINVEAGFVALLFVNGRLRDTLAPGGHAYWRGLGRVKALHVDLREQVADVAGQEIMTADKVTLRLNAVVTFRVVDPQRAVAEVGDHVQALYRQAQLALREVIGTRELDALLADREAVASELVGTLRARVERLGLHVDTVGIRDLILPGEMKELLAQQGDRGEEGSRGRPDHPARGDRGDALAGQHRAHLRVQPDADETEGARGARTGGGQREARGRALRARPRQPNHEVAVSTSGRPTSRPLLSSVDRSPRLMLWRGRSGTGPRRSRRWGDHPMPPRRPRV